MTDVPQIFDRALLKRRRARSAPLLNAHDFLFREVGSRLEDRLADVRRHFPRVLDLGCRNGVYCPQGAVQGATHHLVRCDLSEVMVSRAGGLRIVADDEMLPFVDGSFDLIVSNLSLHWVNDLPGTLIQIRRCLAPDGLFLGALFGAGTLRELRSALVEAELEVEGGTRPRVSPFADVRDLGNLLQRAGLTLPVVDIESVTVMYRDPFRLLKDLRGMGETNAVAAQARHFSRRQTIMRALKRLATSASAPSAGGEPGIPTTFDIIFLSGWCPDASQPKPLPRGSGKVSISEALSAK